MFHIDNIGYITAYVTMPSGKKAYPKIEDNKDGTVTVRYQPQETGLHELHVCYNQQEIPGMSVYSSLGTPWSCLEK